MKRGLRRLRLRVGCNRAMSEVSVEACAVSVACGRKNNQKVRHPLATGSPTRPRLLGFKV